MKGIAVKTANISGTVGGGTGNVPRYTGRYTVVPLAEDRTVLATSGRLMTDNVTVERIPCYEVSNTAGGITLVIAERT